jgi:hypothetical protein
MTAIKVDDLVRILVGAGDTSVFGLPSEMHRFKGELAVVVNVVGAGHYRIKVVPLVGSAKDTGRGWFYEPRHLELLPYKLNPKLPRSVYAEAPKDATHYNKNTPCKFLKVRGDREIAYFGTQYGWTRYHYQPRAREHLEGAELLYIPTIRGKPGTVLSEDEWDSSLSIFPKEILMQIAESKAQQVAPKYQTQQELLDETASLQKQIVKLEARIEKKRNYRKANIRKIEAWRILMEE